jgi:hypothetical protein
MPTVISGDGTITGLVAGGLTDAIITQAELDTGVAGTGPAFSAYKSAAQTLAYNTLTKVTFNTEEFDTNNNFASSTFTPTVAGYYQINVKGWFTGTANRDYFLSPRLYKNGSSISTSGISIKALGSAAELSVDLSKLVYMNGTTDYLEVYAYTLDYTASGTVDLAGGLPYTTFNGSLVRAA